MFYLWDTIIAPVCQEPKITPHYRPFLLDAERKIHSLIQLSLTVYTKVKSVVGAIKNMPDLTKGPDNIKSSDVGEERTSPLRVPSTPTFFSG